MITNVDEDVEKLEFSDIVGVIGKWYKHFGKLQQLLKRLNIITTVPHNSNPGCISKRTENVSTKKALHKCS